jgi:hypothetical protein
LGRPSFAIAEELKDDIESDQPSPNGDVDTNNPVLETPDDQPPDPSQPIASEGNDSPEPADSPLDSPTTSKHENRRMSAIYNPKMLMPRAVSSTIPASSSSTSAPTVLTKAGSAGSTPMNTTPVGLEVDACSTHVPFYRKDEGGLRSPKMMDKETQAPYQEVYYIGVIDFLQKYNKKKRLAKFAKSFKYKEEELSTVEPSFYMRRFLKMVEKVLE